MPLYAWSPQRRANRVCIRHHIEEALRKKEFVSNLDPSWRDRASDMSLQMVRDYDAKSVKQLARDSLEYHRMRAWLGFGSGAWPWDRPAFDLWIKLTGVIPSRATA